MTKPLVPLLSLADADNAGMCGSDGCMLPTSHPASNLDASYPKSDRESDHRIMPRIAIVTGSIRKGRVNPQVAQYIYDIASKRDGAEYEILDIADFNLPLFSEPVPAVLGTDYQTPEAHPWSRAVASYDGYVFIVAEYNRGITAALKSAIDYLYPEWNDKAAGIVTYGSSGGTIAGAALRDILSTLQVATVTNSPVFNLFTDFENMSVFKPSPVHNGAIDALLDQVEKWAKALAAVRVPVAA